MKISIFILFIFLSFYSFSYITKIQKIESKAMNKKIGVTVILPTNYNKNKKYSVIYALHGWGQSFRTFSKVKEIKEMADKYEIIYVFPDGNWNSWYIDSKIKNNSKYSTFISKELVLYIDENYSTFKDRKHRAITGFSMGGFGAFYNGINNNKTFGNIGGISSGVNVQKFQKKWGIWKVIANGSDEKLWNEYNIYKIIHKLKENKEKTNIIMECGESDFFLEVNRELKEKMKELGIEYIYEERKGKHNKKFWKEAMKNQTKFFVEKFME